MADLGLLREPNINFCLARLEPCRYPGMGQWPGDGQEMQLAPDVAGSVLSEYAKATMRTVTTPTWNLFDPNLEPFRLIRIFRADRGGAQ